MFVKKRQAIPKIMLVFPLDEISELGHSVLIAVFATLSAEIHIQTYREHLMFVWKCQAILGITLVLLWANFLSLCIPQNHLRSDCRSRGGLK